jgi:putative phosphoribosyl transferase
MVFHDRDDAGRRLAQRLSREKFQNPIVFALPRGGVPVAMPVALALGAVLEVFVARKVGAPGEPELGIGAIAEGDDDVTTSAITHQLGIDSEQLQRLAVKERVELARRVARYRGATSLPPIEGRDIILVDDGLATGVTAEAALRSLRKHRPRRIVLAVPVCPPDTARRLASIADDVICVETPTGMGAIGSWYADFAQTSDDEVITLLQAVRSRTHTSRESMTD